MKKLKALVCALMVVTSVLVMDCSRSQPSKHTNSGTTTASTITMDGSSTVYPIVEALAEEYRKVDPTVRVTVGISGTGGGFKKFVMGEIDISNASRPITLAEKELAEKHHIEYLEFPIAYDGIAVVVNLKNTFVETLTTHELKQIWEVNSKIQNWNDVRSIWPSQKINLYGPGTDSGTFDYFTLEICGKARASRSDFSPSENDNILVQGISGDQNALGYFGFSYYQENKDRLKLVGIVSFDQKKPVFPSFETISNHTYKPLSRPLYMYVHKKAAKENRALQKLMIFFFQQAPALIRQVGLVPLLEKQYTQTLKSFQTVIHEEQKDGDLQNKKKQHSF